MLDKRKVVIYALSLRLAFARHLPPGGRLSSTTPICIITPPPKRRGCWTLYCRQSVAVEIVDSEMTVCVQHIGFRVPTLREGDRAGV